MDELKSLILKINDAIINPVILLLFSLALLYFLWGVFLFIKDSDSEEGRETGKRHIVWGIVGMTIMFSVFGIITLIRTTVESIDKTPPPSNDLPTFPQA